MKSTIKLLSLIGLVLALPSFAEGQGRPDGVGRCGPDNAAVHRLSAVARRAGLAVTEASAVSGKGHGHCYTALPMTAAAVAEGDDLPGGVALALLEIDGAIRVLTAEADPAAVSQAERDTQAGIPPERGNARCRLLTLSGDIAEEFACDLQSVKGPVSPDLPADNVTLDAGLLASHTIGPAPKGRIITIRVWVEGWGIRVCGDIIRI